MRILRGALRKRGRVGVAIVRANTPVTQNLGWLYGTTSGKLPGRQLSTARIAHHNTRQLTEVEPSQNRGHATLLASTRIRLGNMYASADRFRNVLKFGVP
jgi:hypothetical protein